jgi:3-ketosteroid 9alpha-monooxygenase subunit B
VVERTDPRWEHGYHPLGVKRVIQETADTRSLVLEVSAELVELFRYRAGQFCTFRVHIDGNEQARSYSMSSAPETDDDLTVTVKRVPGGLVSNWFHDHVREGDTLEVTKPAGVFCLGPSQGPVVAFVGGSGVTPVMSIAKSLLAGTPRSIRILYANTDRPAIIFDEQLAALELEHGGRLEVRRHLDADGGYLDAAAVAAFAAGQSDGDELDADFYICGPGPFMDLVESTLVDAGVSPDRILIERFVTPDQPRAGRQPSLGALDETVKTVKTDETDEPEVPDTVSIILKGTTTTVTYQPGDTVLETARRGGLAPPYSCEAGNCATCMAILRDGEATMRANTALEPDEVEEGWILTCQALPRGRAVTVEYEAL